MHMTKAILFDLDGTLTDSGEGILNCATVTLEHFGLPVPDREEMRVFVGPPLRDTFYKYGVPAERLDEAVAVYRKRYVPTGMFENSPYPGIETLLGKLTQLGHQLYVATSKPEWMAVEILKHFHLDAYFTIIAGATMDGVRDAKADVIAYLLEQCGKMDAAVMVGDTAFDVIGAKAHGIPTIGVSWGYGTVANMLDAGAVRIADTTDELFEYLK